LDFVAGGRPGQPLRKTCGSLVDVHESGYLTR